MTPVPASLARPLVESLRNEVVCGVVFGGMLKNITDTAERAGDTPLQVSH